MSILAWVGVLALSGAVAIASVVAYTNRPPSIALPDPICHDFRF